MFSPVRLALRGFRGFRDLQEFVFDRQVTELFGDNRSGKSSTLNAIEWALFGNDCCCTTHTGIRERREWVVPNQHAGDDDVLVELELCDDGAPVVIRRTLEPGRRQGSLKEGLELVLPDQSI